MRLTFKTGTRDKKVIEVQPSDRLFILLEKLHITDKNTFFIFNGLSYSMASIQTFQEIGLTSDQMIAVNNQAIAGI